MFYRFLDVQQLQRSQWRAQFSELTFQGRELTSGPRRRINVADGVWRRRLCPGVVAACLLRAFRDRSYGVAPPTLLVGLAKGCARSRHVFGFDGVSRASSQAVRMKPVDDRDCRSGDQGADGRAGQLPQRLTTSSELRIRLCTSVLQTGYAPALPSAKRTARSLARRATARSSCTSVTREVTVHVRFAAETGSCDTGSPPGTP